MYKIATVNKIHELYRYIIAMNKLVYMGYIEATCHLLAGGQFTTICIYCYKMNTALDIYVSMYNIGCTYMHKKRKKEKSRLVN